MNYSFYEGRAKEKVEKLLKEGQQSQAIYNSGAPKIDLLRNLPKPALLFLGILGLLILFVL